MAVTGKQQTDLGNPVSFSVPAQIDMSFHSGILGPHDEHDRVDSCGPWPLEEHKLDLSSIDGSADILVIAKASVAPSLY